MRPRQHRSSVCLTVGRVHSGTFSSPLGSDFLSGNITQPIFCLDVDNVKSLPACLKQLKQAAAPTTSSSDDLMFAGLSGLWTGAKALKPW